MMKLFKLQDKLTTRRHTFANHLLFSLRHHEWKGGSVVKRWGHLPTPVKTACQHIFKTIPHERILISPHVYTLLGESAAKLAKPFATSRQVYGPDITAPLALETEYEVSTTCKTCSIDDKAVLEWGGEVTSEWDERCVWRMRSYDHPQTLNLKIRGGPSTPGLINSSTNRPLLGKLALENIYRLNIFQMLSSKGGRNVLDKILTNASLVYISNTSYGTRRRWRQMAADGGWWRLDEEVELPLSTHPMEIALPASFNNAALPHEERRTPIVEGSVKDVFTTCAPTCSHSNFIALKHNGVNVKIHFNERSLFITSPTFPVKIIPIPQDHVTSYSQNLYIPLKGIVWNGELIKSRNQDLYIIFGTPYAIPNYLQLRLLKKLNHILIPLRRKIPELSNIHIQTFIRLSPSLPPDEDPIALLDRAKRQLISYWQEKGAGECDGLIFIPTFESLAYKIKDISEVDLLFNGSGFVTTSNDYIFDVKEVKNPHRVKLENDQTYTILLGADIRLDRRREDDNLNSMKDVVLAHRAVAMSHSM